MTVTVTLQDGETDKYMRFGDAYIKHSDATLDVVRGGAKQPHSYAPGAWTNVKGDEKQLNRRLFQRWFHRKALDTRGRSAPRR